MVKVYDEIPLSLKVLIKHGIFIAIFLPKKLSKFLI